MSDEGEKPAATSMFGGSIIIEGPTNRSESLSRTINSMIETIEKIYRPCTAFQLSQLTHQPGTPWDITRRKSGIGTVIPDELIRKHYVDLLGHG